MRNRPKSAHGRLRSRTPVMTEERAVQILQEPSPRLYKRSGRFSTVKAGGQKSRELLAASPLLKHKGKIASNVLKGKKRRKIDTISSLARFEALRLHSLVDLPDLPTSILGARSQAKKLLQEMNDKIPQMWQESPEIKFLNEHERNSSSNYKYDSNFPLLTSLYSYDCNETIEHLQVVGSLYRMKLGQENQESNSFRKDFELTIKNYNDTLKLILSFYQRVTAQCATLCKERGEIMAKALLSYMNLVKSTYTKVSNTLLHKFAEFQVKHKKDSENQLKQISHWRSLATGFKDTNQTLQDDVNAAFMESSDFISATEHLIETICNVSEEMKNSLRDQCRKTIDRVLGQNNTKQLTNAKNALHNEVRAVEEELSELKNVRSGEHPASKCRAAANLCELMKTLLGRSQSVMNHAEHCGRKYLSKTEHGLKKNMDEVSRLTVLSQKLKVQLENQKLRLEEQGKEIVTSRQQIAFYRGENIDMRHKIKELERDLRMANSTIEDYEHLLSGNKDNIRHVSSQTDMVEERIEKKEADIDFVSLANNPFKIDANITMLEPRKKKYSKRRKSSIEDKGMHHDAEGTFFGALAQASKPPKRVFLRKGKKKTKDQHAVKLLKSQKLMKQLLELIMSKNRANDADDRMCLSRQNLTDYIYDYYLNLYGTFEIADKRVVSLMASICTHRNFSPRVRAIERFCLLGPGPFLSESVLNFYLLCWDTFIALQGNNTHGSIWQSIVRGDYEVSEWIGTSIAKRVIVKSNLEAEELSDFGPFVLRLKPAEVKASVEYIQSLLPTKLDVFMDILVAEFLKAGNCMEEAMEKLFIEKSKKSKPKGLAIDDFKALLFEIDPTLPPVRVTTMFRNGCKLSSSSEYMDKNAFKLFVQSSRYLLQYAEKDLDDLKRKNNEIFRQNKEDLLQLQQEWNKSTPKIDRELLVLAKCGCEVLGDDKYYNKAQRCKHAFIKSLKAAIAVNDASVGWESYNHLLEAIEHGMQCVSKKAKEKAEKDLLEQERLESSTATQALQSGPAKRKTNYANTISLGASAMWTNMSTSQRARFNA